MLAEIHKKLASPEIEKEIPQGTSICSFFRISNTHGFKFFRFTPKSDVLAIRRLQLKAWKLGFAPQPKLGPIISIEYNGFNQHGYITRTIKQTLTEKYGYETHGRSGGAWDVVKLKECRDDVVQLKQDMRAHNFTVSDFHGNNLGYDENGRLLCIDFS